MSGSRERVLGIALRLEAGGGLDHRDAFVCAEALRRYAESESVFAVADVIEQRIGLSWHDPRVIQAAREIARLFEPT